MSRPLAARSVATSTVTSPLLNLANKTQEKQLRQQVAVERAMRCPRSIRASGSASQSEEKDTSSAARPSNKPQLPRRCDATRRDATAGQVGTKLRPCIKARHGELPSWWERTRKRGFRFPVPTRTSCRQIRKHTNNFPQPAPPYHISHADRS